MNEESIKFTYKGVGIEQFAMIDTVDGDSGTLNISASARFNYDDRAIGIGMNIQFVSSEAPFLIIETMSHFVIDEECWNTLSNGKMEDVTLPKEFVEHLHAIALGTTRGVLIGKTDGTKFGKYFLPLINATQLGCADLVIKKELSE